MNKTVIIVGYSGTGKSTLQENLVKDGFERIVTYTTRPPREGETDGVDYNFISEEEFAKLVETEMFAEYTSYNTTFAGTVYYGSLAESYSKGKDKVIVLNPEGLMAVLCNLQHLNPIIIYLSTIDSNLLEERLRQRGDSEKEIERRLGADAEDFVKLDAFLSSDLVDIPFTLINIEVKGLDEIPLYLHVKQAIEGLSD